MFNEMAALYTSYFECAVKLLPGYSVPVFYFSPPMVLRNLRPEAYMFAWKHYGAPKGIRIRWSDNWLHACREAKPISVHGSASASSGRS